MSKHFCKICHNPSHKEWYKSNKEPKLVNMPRHGLGGVFTAFKLFSEGKGGKAHKVAMICTFCLKNCQRKHDFTRFITRGLLLGAKRKGNILILEKWGKDKTLKLELKVHFTFTK